MNWIVLMVTNYYMAATSIKPAGVPQVNANEASIKSILSIVFAVAGALALLIIVISGLRYILASGDPQKTAKAKEGIIYALIGLAIALTAQAIVSFVVGRI